MTPPTPPTGTPRDDGVDDVQPARLLKSMLTGSVYAVTAYTEKPHPDPDRAADGETVIVADKKADVTDDYRALADAEHAARALLDDPLAQAVDGIPDEEALRAAMVAASTVHSDTIDTPTPGADQAGAR